MWGVMGVRMGLTGESGSSRVVGSKAGPVGRSTGGDEANVPAEEAEGKDEARVLEAQLDGGRQEGAVAAAREGQEAADDAVGADVASERRRRHRGSMGRRVLGETVRGGRAVRTPYFKLRYRTGVGPPGVAFLAGRGVGGAVRRNRAKRVLREAFRTTTIDLSGIEALVFIATDRAATESFADVKSALVAALRDASDTADSGRT